MGDLVIPKRRLQEDYTFTAFDWVQMPFALLIGGLNVMDDVSNGYKCSRNTTTCRTQLKRGFEYFNTSDSLEGWTAMHLAGA